MATSSMTRAQSANGREWNTSLEEGMTATVGGMLADVRDGRMAQEDALPAILQIIAGGYTGEANTVEAWAQPDALDKWRDTVRSTRT